MNTLLDLPKKALDELAEAKVEDFVKKNPHFDAPAHRATARDAFLLKMFKDDLDRVACFVAACEEVLPKDFRVDAEHTLLDCILRMRKTIEDYRRTRKWPRHWMSRER